jgi:hypothetical protein
MNIHVALYGDIFHLNIVMGIRVQLFALFWNAFF